MVDEAFDIMQDRFDYMLNTPDATVYDRVFEEMLSYVGKNYEKFKYMTFVDFRKHIILVFKEKCKL